jgi:hypothetical protein
MPTTLEVWIMKPGSVCRVDDVGKWKVNVFDSHGNILVWNGETFKDREAGASNWTCWQFPPGVYVVQAYRDNPAAITDHAIVSTGCEGVVCVRLYVDGEGSRGRPTAGCSLKITDVRGRGERPSAIRVQGKATECKEVEVTVSCGGRKTHETVVPVTSGGSWEAMFENDPTLGCRCGQRIYVVARCTHDPSRCYDVFEAPKLVCDSVPDREPK